MEDSRIKKALKRLEGAECKVILRGGEVCKIPCQEVEMQEKDGIIVKYRVTADITD